MAAFLALVATIATLFGVNTSIAGAVDVTGGVVNGFEVDGNEVVNTAGQFDWKALSPTAVLTNMTDGNSPDFGFKGSSKENEPENWSCQSKDGGITPGKDNILRTYISTDIQQDAATLGLAFVRAEGGGNGPTGDTHVNFELNRGAISFNAGQANGPCPYVGRLPGDLLLSFAFPGNGQATVTAFTWDGDVWVEFGIPNTVVTTVAATDNASAIAAADDISGGAIPARAFGEAAVDLIALDDLTPDDILSCPGFGHVSIRSRASGESFDSALQDHMGGSIDLSTCGKVIVHKTDDAGTPLAGAVFGLYGSHDDAANHVNEIDTCTSVADGSCTFDEVSPGTYYVSEISAPPGYSVDPTVSDAITVLFRQTVDVTEPVFVDPRDTGFVKVVKALVDLAGAPVTPTDPSVLNGATFLLYSDGNGNDVYDAGEEVHLWPNPPADGTDLATCTITNSLGYCAIGPVETGSYRLTETVAPAQTNKGPDVAVTVTKTTAESPVVVTFTNSLNPLQIHLEKSGPATANIGDIFNYTFAVTTSGPRLHDIVVAELLPDRCNNGPITGPVKTGGNQDAFLEVGETWTYTCSHLTTPADGTSLLNTARATGTDDFGRTVSDDDDHTVTILYPDLQVVKSAAQSPIDSGSAAGFTITTTNLGPGKALNVTSTDTLPAGTWTIGGADGGSCSGTSGTMTCAFGTMLSGESRVVTLTRATTIADCGTLHNTVSVASTYNGTNIDSTLANNTSSADVVVNCPDVEVHKTAETGTISAGDTARFTITVHNLGAGTATGVTLSDPLPSAGALPWVIDSQSIGMGCAIGSGNLSCGPFDLAPDGTKTVVISAVTSAAVCGTLPNLVTIAVVGGDTNSGNNSSNASITVLCPDLDITKTADADSVSAGDPIGFTITVSNADGDDVGTAKDVVLNDPLPSGVDWTIEAPVPAGCAIASGTLICTARDLAPGESLVVHVTAATTQDDCAVYSNTATADGSNTDPVTASDSTTVLCPDLDITKTADDDVVDAGDAIGFTITVSNADGDDVGTAKGVVLNDPLPSGVDWTIEAPAPAGCAIASGTLTCTARDLAPGESLVVHVTAATTEDNCGVYENTATADGSNTDPVTASASTEVDCPDLAITKTADDDVVDAGDQIGFMITVSNGGGEGVGTAKGVTLHDPLPTGDGISWTIESTAGVTVTCAIVAGALDCGPVDLGPGESFAVHVVSPTPGGIDNPSLPAACKAYDNTAVADATNSASVTASDSTTLRCPLAIQIVKDGPASAVRGQSVTYTFAVTNIGDVDLVDVDLSDAKCDAGTLKQISNGDGDAVLAVGETWNYTCTRVIRADDPDPLPNTATVVGTDSQGRVTQDTDDHEIDIVDVVVLPEVIERAPLARTGFDATPWVRLAAILVALGGVFVLSSRQLTRRRSV